MNQIAEESGHIMATQGKRKRKGKDKGKGKGKETEKAAGEGDELEQDIVDTQLPSDLESEADKVAKKQDIDIRGEGDRSKEDKKEDDEGSESDSESSEGSEDDSDDESGSSGDEQLSRPRKKRLSHPHRRSFESYA